MKCFFLIAFIFSCGMLKSQDYLPMLEEDHSWHIAFYQWQGATTTNLFTVGGSTVINGKTYKSVYFDGIETNCLLREEGPVVYKYIESLNDEIVFFDFSMEIDDFINVPAIDDSCSGVGNSGFAYDLYVRSVETQSIAGEDRRVLGLSEISNGEPYYYWIEGIGCSEFGLDRVSYIIDAGSEMTCFTYEGQSYFFNNYDVCDYNTTTGIDDFFMSTVVLAPNPVTGISTLQFSSEGAADKVHILDIFGRVISELKIETDQVIIDGNQFPSGLYFYQIFSEKQLLATEKFIVR